MIITVTSFKGGVGKTTTSVHLAEYFKTKGKTILLDSDPNESALAWSERGKLDFNVITDTGDIPNDYKYLIVDSPARPTDDEIKTLVQESDLMLIPTTCDVLSIDALLRIVGTLQSLKATNYLILLTQTPPRSNAPKDARELLNENNLPVAKTEIRRRAVFSKSALIGTTVKNIKDGAESWSEIRQLGKEILNYGK